MMNNSCRSRSVLIILCIAACPGCSQEDDASSVQAGRRKQAGPPAAYVVNYPLMYFASRIAGDLVEVAMPIPPDVDPALWNPDVQAIQAYQQADLILLNGADYAGWVPKTTLSRSRMVDTSTAFRDRVIKIPDAVTHGHGPEGEHSHSGSAFTTWLDPTLAIQQASAIRQAFQTRWPEHRTSFETGFGALEKDLVALDGKMQAVVTKDKARPLLVSHPVYQYWTRRYGLNVKSVHWEPDEMPSAEAFKALEKLRANHPARWMIWEGPPLEATVKRLEAMGIQSVVFQPCGNKPVTGDYLQVMSENLVGLARVFAR